MRTKNAETTVRLPTTLLTEVEKIARMNHRSIVGEVMFVLERYVYETSQRVDWHEATGGGFSPS